MLARSLVFRNVLRFCTKGTTTETVVSKTSDELIQAEKREDLEVPLHLQPYNKAKYEVPMKKIKKNSGYALVQIEPFPRGRIMKICYHILAEVRKDIPEDFFFRVLIEERTKFIMEVVDKTEDIAEIEKLLGNGLPVEIYTRSLADQLTLIEMMRKAKLWEKKEEFQKEFEEDFVRNHNDMLHHTNPQYKKPERTKATFV